MKTTTIGSVFVLLLVASGFAEAQVLGTFRWQLQPHCNVVTVVVTQNGGVYRLEGVDDQCGSGKAASASGMGFLNPDGSIGIGLTIVAAPSGAPVHVEASLDPASFNGAWHDSAGRSGTLAFAPAGGTGGAPRPPIVPALSGITLGYGLLTSGDPIAPSLQVNLNTIKSGINLREPSFGSFGMGSFALTSVTADGFDNTAFGVQSLYRTTTGDGNTAFGYESLPANTTGGDNVAVGAFAMRASVSGDDNVAIGASALNRLTVNSGNIAVGSGALGALQLGNNNIAIGSSTGLSLVAGNNNIYIGTSGSNLDNYTTRIGVNGAQYLTYIGGIRGATTGIANAVPVVIDSAGQLGTVSSSRRYKEDIADLGAAGRAIQRLRPVQFRYTKPYADGSKPLQYGLIAEEVAEVLPDIVAYDDGGRPETVMYQVLPTFLLAEVQRLERERTSMASENQELRERLDRLERLLDTLSAAARSPVAIK